MIGRGNAMLANPEVLGRIIDRVPLGRLGEPEDVVGPVVFLVPDASAMITGRLLPVDGGVASIVKISDEPVIRRGLEMRTRRGPAKHHPHSQETSAR